MRRMTARPTVRLGLLLALLALALDQLSKWALMAYVVVPSRAVEVTPFFHLVMVWNPGVSFGMLGMGTEFSRWALTLLALGITALLCVWLARTPKRFEAAALGLVIGGAIGNVIDRLRWGAVADFFDFHWQGIHWPAFNVADTAIFIGVALLVAEGLFSGKDSRHEHTDDDAKTH